MNSLIPQHLRWNQNSGVLGSFSLLMRGELQHLVAVVVVVFSLDEINDRLLHQ